MCIRQKLWASTNVVTHPERVHVVDGKVITADDFMVISPSKIESIKIVKSKDNPDFQKYAKANSEVVMMITTRKIFSRISFNQ